MSFFDTVKKAATTVGKSATTVVDSAKLKAMEGETKLQILKDYESLGKLVYDAEKNGTDCAAEKAELMESIDDAKKRLEEIAEQLLKFGNKIVCENCGEVNSTASFFCAKCGAKIEKDSVEEVDAQVCDENKDNE